jgi:hypothetical protein
MAEQPKDPLYETVLEPWLQIPGNVSKVQHQVWVDALKETLTHHQQIEGLLS